MKSPYAGYLLYSKWDLICVFLYVFQWAVHDMEQQCVPLAGSPGKCWFTKRREVQYIYFSYL
jgi:hypothetical protein